MSLRERRGNLLSAPTKDKRTESYFALPVSLRNNTETAFGQILTIGKGALNSLSSKFWEFINPTVEPNVQVNPVRNNNEAEKVDERAENLPFKRKNEDNLPVCVKKRAVQRESVEVQTDPYVVIKIPGRINLNRNQESVVKGLDLFGDMETKGTDDDEEDLGKGKKRVRRASRQKIWIQRGPSLEIIPEKLNEGGKDKKFAVFGGTEKKENFVFNPAGFASPQKLNTAVETVKTGGLFAWSAEQTSKLFFGPQDPVKRSLDLPVDGPKRVESSLFTPASNALFTNFTPNSPVLPSDAKPTLTLFSKLPDLTPVESTLINPTEIKNPSLLKPSEIKVPSLSPQEPTIKPVTSQNLTAINQPVPVQTFNPPTISPEPAKFTQPVELKTVIENAQSNPFLNRSIVNSQHTSYKFGEIKSDPVPVVFPQIPQVKSTTDIEMDTFITCDSKVPENNFQSFAFAPSGFQPSFTPLNVFPTSAPVVGTGIFGGNLPFNNQNTVPQPKSTGFNLGIISNQNQKRGRK